MGCHVLVELAQRHREAGNRYHVRIDLTVPGEEIVVAHEASLHATDQDIHLAKATKQDEADPERKTRVISIFSGSAACSPCVPASAPGSVRMERPA